MARLSYQKYHVYRYEGPINDIDNAVVLLSWKEYDTLYESNLRWFLSTDIELSNEKIFYYYAKLKNNPFNKAFKVVI